MKHGNDRVASKTKKMKWADKRFEQTYKTKGGMTADRR